MKDTHHIGVRAGGEVGWVRSHTHTPQTMSSSDNDEALENSGKRHKGSAKRRKPKEDKIFYVKAIPMNRYGNYIRCIATKNEKFNMIMDLLEPDAVTLGSMSCLVTYYLQVERITPTEKEEVDDVATQLSQLSHPEATRDEAVAPIKPTNSDCCMQAKILTISIHHVCPRTSKDVLRRLRLFSCIDTNMVTTRFAKVKKRPISRDIVNYGRETNNFILFHIYDGIPSCLDAALRLTPETCTELICVNILLRGMSRRVREFDQVELSIDDLMNLQTLTRTWLTWAYQGDPPHGSDIPLTCWVPIWSLTKSLTITRLLSRHVKRVENSCAGVVVPAYAHGLRAIFDERSWTTELSAEALQDLQSLPLQWPMVAENLCIVHSPETSGDNTIVCSQSMRSLLCKHGSVLQHADTLGYRLHEPVDELLQWISNCKGEPANPLIYVASRQQHRVVAWREVTDCMTTGNVHEIPMASVSAIVIVDAHWMSISDMVILNSLTGKDSQQRPPILLVGRVGLLGTNMFNAFSVDKSIEHENASQQLIPNPWLYISQNVASPPSDIANQALYVCYGWASETWVLSHIENKPRKIGELRVNDWVLTESPDKGPQMARQITKIMTSITSTNAQSITPGYWSAGTQIICSDYEHGINVPFHSRIERISLVNLATHPYGAIVTPTSVFILVFHANPALQDANRYVLSWFLDSNISPHNVYVLVIPHQNAPSSTTADFTHSLLNTPVSHTPHAILKLACSGGCKSFPL